MEHCRQIAMTLASFGMGGLLETLTLLFLSCGGYIDR